MPAIYWKKKTKDDPINLIVPYKGLCHEYGFDNGYKTNHIVEIGNKVIRGEEKEIVKRLLPNHYNSIDCIYYIINAYEISKDWQEELKITLNLFNSLLSEKGVLVISVDEEIVELINSLNSQPFSTNKNELHNSLNSIYIDRACTILSKFTSTTDHINDLLRLNKLDNGKRRFIVMEPIDLKKDTITEALLSNISDENLHELSLNYYTMGEPLFIGKDQELLNENIPVKQIREYIWFSETRTDYYSNTFSIDEPYLLGIKNDTAYYFFFEVGENAALNFDTLSIIKSNAKRYIVYANECLLPKEFLIQNNIQFKQIPKSIGKI